MNREIKSRDSGEVALVRAELVSLLIKNNQALEVSARLKIISTKATNIVAELCALVVRQGSTTHIACVTLPDEQTVTTNAHR